MSVSTQTSEIVQHDADTPPRPVRILPMGDSITEGWGTATWVGYRDDLFKQLHRLGHDIDFVGSRKDLVQPDGDPDHFGTSGIRIEAINAVVAQQLPPTKPDWVLLHIGTNNMYDAISAAQAPAQLRELVDNILRVCPDTKILLAAIIPSKNALYQANIDAYNREVRAVAEERAGRVHFVDMAHVLQPADDLGDDVHPNLMGYGKMSAAWRDALHPLLPAPQGGPVLTDNPHFQTQFLVSGGNQFNQGSLPTYFPSWRNEGINAYGADLAGTGNGSNAVGMLKVAGSGGISTTLVTRPGTRVRVTFRARPNSLGATYGCVGAAGRRFTAGIDGLPPVTVTVPDGGDWRTFHFDCVPTANMSVLRFSPDGQDGCGPMITDVIAREASD
ncbi:SGNH/GDSL hydrolase family protein [Streptomyces syringium]|uniref:SGNH/GDSL hydrolase family protein n=1 Tax=Streptomyces syringium TaxID=76729 RepID=UPI0034534386